MRVLAALLCCAILALGWDIYSGRNGWQQYQLLSAELQQAQERSELLVKRNDALEAEIEDLKQGSAAIEELARSELGLIKEGETFYRIIGAAQ